MQSPRQGSCSRDFGGEYTQEKVSVGSRVVGMLRRNVASLEKSSILIQREALGCRLQDRFVQLWVKVADRLCTLCQSVLDTKVGGRYAHVALIQHHRLSGFSDINLFSSSSGGQKSAIRVSAGLVPS